MHDRKQRLIEAIYDYGGALGLDIVTNMQGGNLLHEDERIKMLARLRDLAAELKGNPRLDV